VLQVIASQDLISVFSYLDVFTPNMKELSKYYLVPGTISPLKVSLLITYLHSQFTLQPSTRHMEKDILYKSKFWYTGE
jgi:hypothetical protein